jgi:oxygen-independent coproporphyrinogen-3 oxidase
MPLSLYLHIPWCRVRCGYCDFNTYVLPPTHDHNTTSPYLAALRAELAQAARVTGDGSSVTLFSRRVTTVYFGGGTPTLLDPADFHCLLSAIREHFDLDPAAEITTEANPETVTPETLARLRATGLNRLSLGLQSTTPHVLKTLDRVHTPGRALEAVAWARAAGFDSVSLDLIYGTPGESLTDWRATLETALTAEPDHVSAYSLIVEPGTRLAAQIARGDLPAPDEDDLADKYTIADERLTAAGLPWYEVSNWARPGHACRHNLAYWRSADWWGLGAGAHSHVGGVRWWNVRHPTAYAARLQAGDSPAEARETLTPEQIHVERVLLELRLAEGLDPAILTGTEQARVAQLTADGLLTLVRPPAPHPDGPTLHPVSTDRLQLTPTGRLLADRVVRDLLD